jgi:hypothetical protein
MAGVLVLAAKVNLSGRAKREDSRQHRQQLVLICQRSRPNPCDAYGDSLEAWWISGISDCSDCCCTDP